MEQEKPSNKPPGGGYQKVLVNVKEASCSLIMGEPTEEWGKPPSPGLMLFQNSTQEVLQTKHIINNMKKGNARIIHVGNTILTTAVEVGINGN